MKGEDFDWVATEFEAVPKITRYNLLVKAESRNFAKTSERIGGMNRSKNCRLYEGKIRFMRTKLMFVCKNGEAGQMLESV